MPSPYLAINASMRSLATLLHATIERRSSITISGERTMLSSVSMTSVAICPRSTILMPGDENPSVKMSGDSGLKPPGFIAPMSYTCTKQALHATSLPSAWMGETR
ncbi:hypothetical protein D9M72_654280 [compost metagenome]